MINSFAEYYLQICNNFVSDFEQSCNLVSSERQRIFSLLEKIKGINVYPSQANYLMISTGKHNSRDVCVKALGSGLLLKDLSSKDYFGNDNFIRIAIRSKEDNDKLVDVIRKIMETD